MTIDKIPIQKSEEKEKKNKDTHKNVALTK